MTNPYWRFSLLSLGGAATLAVLLSLLIHPLAAWLLMVNLSALVTYRYDKKIARAQQTRVPEAILLVLEGLGGTLGAAAAMWAIRPRHKTRSGGFLAWFFLIACLQVGLIIAVTRTLSM